MTPDEIEAMLEAHRRWLAQGPDGKHADLSDADLHGADLDGITVNWNSHELIGEILWRAATSPGQQMLAAFNIRKAPPETLRRLSILGAGVSREAFCRMLLTHAAQQPAHPSLTLDDAPDSRRSTSQVIDPSTSRTPAWTNNRSASIRVSTPRAFRTS